MSLHDKLCDLKSKIRQQWGFGSYADSVYLDKLWKEYHELVGYKDYTLTAGIPSVPTGSPH